MGITSVGHFQPANGSQTRREFFFMGDSLSSGSVAFEEELSGISPSLESEEEINFVELYIEGKQFKVISLF